jgi:hypothetical protein
MVIWEKIIVYILYLNFVPPTKYVQHEELQYSRYCSTFDQILHIYILHEGKTTGIHPSSICVYYKKI